MTSTVHCNGSEVDCIDEEELFITETKISSVKETEDENIDDENVQGKNVEDKNVVPA